MSENVGASTSRNPKGLHGLYRNSLTFFPFLKNMKYQHGVLKKVSAVFGLMKVNKETVEVEM
jgi:hypothetical protein